MGRIDLHTHSTCSDGTFTPSELMAYASEKHIRAIALTDHDTVSGAVEARCAADVHNLELIPGIELSATYGANNHEIHILGLFIDPNCEYLLSALKTLEEKRNLRNINMICQLNNAGIAITYGDLLNKTGQNIITRAHFAYAIVEKGYCNSMKTAFDKYLSPGCPTYVEKENFSSEESIDIIKRAGGVAILAHPMLYKLDAAALEKMVVTLKEMGLGGIECIYSSHSVHDESLLRQMAKKYHLKVSGGSDFHGNNKSDIDLGTGRGNLYVPYETLEEMRPV